MSGIGHLVSTWMDKLQKRLFSTDGSTHTASLKRLALRQNLAYGIEPSSLWNTLPAELFVLIYDLNSF